MRVARQKHHPFDLRLINQGEETRALSRHILPSLFAHDAFGYDARPADDQSHLGRLPQFTLQPLPLPLPQHSEIRAFVTSIQQNDLSALTNGPIDVRRIDTVRLTAAR